MWLYFFFKVDFVLCKRLTRVANLGYILMYWFVDLKNEPSFASFFWNWKVAKVFVYHCLNERAQYFKFSHLISFWKIFHFVRLFASFFYKLTISFMLWLCVLKSFFGEQLRCHQDSILRTRKSQCLSPRLFEIRLADQQIRKLMFEVDKFQ